MNTDEHNYLTILFTHWLMSHILFNHDDNDYNDYDPLQNQKTATPHLQSEQLLPFGFGRQYVIFTRQS